MNLLSDRQGGDWRGFPPDFVDLATCVNPYGPPGAAVAAAARLDASTLRQHPYGAVQQAASVMAAHLQVPEGELAVGRGISGLLWRIRDVAREQGRVVHVPRPAYTEFREAFGLGDTPDRMRLVEEDIEAGLDRGAMVVIANPENASGAVSPRQRLSELARAYPDGLLVVDESYVDFTDDPRSNTLIGHAPENVCVLRSASKFYGIAGARVGVAWSRGRLIDDFGVREPWPVSGLDAIVLEAALADDAWVDRVRGLLRDDRDWLDDLLVRQDLSVASGSRTNVRLIVDSPSGLADALLEQGVRVRVLDREHGLERRGLRLTPPHAGARSRVEDAFGVAIRAVDRRT